MERSFDRLKDCIICKREIDEVTVKLKKIVTGGDTYSHLDALTNPIFKWEKYCTDCVSKKGIKKMEVIYEEKKDQA